MELTTVHSYDTNNWVAILDIELGLDSDVIEALHLQAEFEVPASGKIPADRMADVVFNAWKLTVQGDGNPATTARWSNQFAEAIRILMRDCEAATRAASPR